MSAVGLSCRKGFSERFVSAFVWLGIPLVALVALPVVAVLAQSIMQGIFDVVSHQSPASGPMPVTAIANWILIAFSIVELATLGVWYVTYFGFRIPSPQRSLAVGIIAASSLNWALLWLGDFAHGDSPAVALTSSVTLLAATTVFCLFYYLELRRQLAERTEVETE